MSDHPDNTLTNLARGNIVLFTRCVSYCQRQREKLMGRTGMGTGQAVHVVCFFVCRNWLGQYVGFFVHVLGIVNGGYCSMQDRYWVKNRILALYSANLQGHAVMAQASVAKHKVPFAVSRAAGRCIQVTVMNHWFYSVGLHVAYR